MIKESVTLKIDDLKHENQLSDIGLKQKHILQVQNVKHHFKLNIPGGKENGKVNS